MQVQARGAGRYLGEGGPRTWFWPSWQLEKNRKATRGGQGGGLIAVSMKVLQMHRTITRLLSIVHLLYLCRRKQTCIHFEEQKRYRMGGLGGVPLEAKRNCKIWVLLYQFPAIWSKNWGVKILRNVGGIKSKIFSKTSKIPWLCITFSWRLKFHFKNGRKF